MTATAARADTLHCPLCGQANACAVAAGQPAQQCWCMGAPVSRAALARLAPGERGRACICPQCAREMPEVPEVPEEGAPPGPAPI